MTGTTGDEWVPATCTLPIAEQPLRVDEFDELLGTVLGLRRVTPTLVTFVLAPGPSVVSTVRDLIRRESACCSFFTFDLVDGDELRLDVAVPPTHSGILDSLAERIARLAEQRA